MQTNQLRRLGILTSGGDAPGMNAAIHGIVRSAAADGITCLGIRRGYAGLINGDVIEMDARSVDGIAVRGGTRLYTARSDEFRTEEGLKKAADTCRYLGIGGVVAIGGDGTFRGARDLASCGISVTCIPATIDNDIACTDYTIGFDTACNTALEAIDKLRDTGQSHERCSIVEVMGRRSGNLALYVGIAAGATAVLIPEKTIDFEAEVIERIRSGRINGRNHHIIVVAEGVGRETDVATMVRESTGMEPRVTILGHIQRGGNPSARDRVTATRMGVHAVDLYKAGMTNRVVVVRESKICDVDITEGLEMKRGIDESMYSTAVRVSI